ncbi:MAG: hypothetical protein K2O14_00550 [Oscillospiraceae bacterium]|nr:hypothetical protein [Oscillospiraceae bacterium]
MRKEVFSADIAELGISQMYLCRERVLGVEKWFDMSRIGEYALPVFDFGNGRLTLTDGHSRAFVMLKNGVKSVTVRLDNDEMITSELGQRLYKKDIEWCGERGLHSIADLSGRILPEIAFDVLWRQRCGRLYNLFTATDLSFAEKAEMLFPQLTLYGAGSGGELYFESGERYFVYKNGELTEELNVRYDFV